MNLRLVARYLGYVSCIIGASMLFSLPWCSPICGQTLAFEWLAFVALSGAAAVAVAVGLTLIFCARRATGDLLRRESLAVVGGSWIWASLLGALPFWWSGTVREAGRAGDAEPIRMSFVDCLFESTSGFTGTGATVITDLERPEFVSRAILFWRSETHFLGGLGIMVLFVALLGQGANAKAVLRAELPGLRKETAHARVQTAARSFALVYLGLNFVLTALLIVEGMTTYDALCHSFGAIATGGFSTYNASVAHFDSALIDWTLVVFMMVSCINFTLLYLLFIGRPRRLLADVELRTYLAILGLSIALLIGVGLTTEDFERLPESARFVAFQVTSVMTNTGFATHDFSSWNSFARGWLLVLMFVGGCAGSTSCSIKVIRYLLLMKSVQREIERSYRPNLVRNIRLQGEIVDEILTKHVFLYFSFVAVIFASSWFTLMSFEPPQTWAEAGVTDSNLPLDCASAVAACLNGVGPGLGLVGPTQTYAALQTSSKILLAFLMLLGRLEIFPIIVLFSPRFWRSM